MNLFVFPYQSENFYTSPDTAVCRDAADSGKLVYYVPDKIETIRAIPLVFVKISRAGKCVRQDYAHRHYSVCGYGVHLATYDVNEGNTLDNSIFLSEATQIEGSGPYEGFDFFDSAIERASEYMSLRTGDIIALELEDVQAFEIEPENSYSLSYKDFVIELRS